MTIRVLWMVVFAGGLMRPQAQAALTASDLVDLSIEQLMNESVTSVSKKETKLSQSPAAIAVITGDDILRLGITSLPEAMRLVPGLDVAQIDASHWAISSRGFNQQYANKLLVLMDGRSIYTPTFGGVYWGVQDMMLEDLDRIEVIRGPGASLWGANAVNGVINMTSKNSRDTQGLLVSNAFGTEGQPVSSIRYGGTLSPTLHYRAYLKYSDQQGMSDISGVDANDSWDSIRGGFRMDWEPSMDDLVTLQGDYYSVHANENFTLPLLTPPFSEDQQQTSDNHGGNLLGRWTRTLSDKSSFSLLAYFDSFQSENIGTVEQRETADIQFEHRFPLGERNDILWGLEYRTTTDTFNNSPFIVFNPAGQTLNTYSAFLQDEISLVPRKLALTLGSKFEFNDYTGPEAQPSVRLLWTPTEKQSVWASASHAVSTPSRVSRDASIYLAAFQPTPTDPVVQVAATGNSGVTSENLDAFEIGYRIEPSANFSVDLATFYNVYRDIVGFTRGDPRFVSDPQPHVEVPANFGNNRSCETYGAELSCQWKPVDDWRLCASYGLFEQNMKGEEVSALGSPQQQAALRSYLTLPWNLELNAFLSFTDEVAPRTADRTIVPIPAYLRGDLGMIWHATKNLEIGVWGYNLLDDSHPEFVGQTTRTVTEIPRSVMGKLTWRF